jgi:hypothetical protein
VLWPHIYPPLWFFLHLWLCLSNDLLDDFCFFWWWILGLGCLYSQIYTTLILSYLLFTCALICASHIWLLR